MASDAIPATESGFSWADADALGCKWVAEERPFVAAWRVDGAVLEWTGETVVEVLDQIQRWDAARRRRGVAASVPAAAVRIVAGPGVAGPGGVNP